jgi:hypothetical protein
MTYAFLAWQVAVDTHLSRLQCLQNKVPHITGNFPRGIPICDLHVAFNIQYVHDFITQFCRQQAKVT